MGRHNHKRESFGHSVVYSPWGDLLGQLGAAEPDLQGRAEAQGGDGDVRVVFGASAGPLCHGEALLVVDLDPGEVARVRESMPIDAHRAEALGVVRGAMVVT